MTKSIDEHWIVYAEGQVRFNDDISRLSQTVWRPAIAYQLSPEWSVWGGYAFLTSVRAGAQDTQEHRAWQGVTWKSKVHDAKVLSQTRLEQRWVDPGDDTGWRLRESVKLIKPFENQAGFDAVGHVEGILALNDTDWGAERGVDQVRLFAGVGRNMANGVRVEGGYLNQYIHSRRGNSRMNHLLSLKVFL